MKEKIQGIQMIGTQRSGSNLLRVMLDAVDQITGSRNRTAANAFHVLIKKYRVEGLFSGMIGYIAFQRTEIGAVGKPAHCRRRHKRIRPNKIFASEQAIPDAKHRGITPALTRLVNEPDAKMEKRRI